MPIANGSSNLQQSGGIKPNLTSQRINRSITALETAGGGRMAEKLLLYYKYI